jgi:alginate O-acetyltransferase complex protein AlgI
MLFCTLEFVAFFAIVFVVYWSLPWQQARVYCLLAASFVFYASWNKWLAILIVFSTTIDYAIARAMDTGGLRQRWRKTLLTLSIVFNVGLLCYFKYMNFFLRSLEEALRSAGAESSLPILSVILPVGISFYTFEAISYTVDVYRRKIAAERNLAHLLVFILFFPHLIAGPIVRGSDFLPQIRRPKKRSWLRFGVGARLILLGMFKKMAIADRMALIVEPIFADPASFSTATLWMAAIAYAFQIYCDFSGYSDMALGTAHMLGYHLKINFNMPFVATNVSDFWRRWHISLSNWIRDYIFIPLGGSRASEWKTARNLLIAMTLCGLWHGAAWTFVIWGAMNGVFMIVHRWFRRSTQDRPWITAALRTKIGTLTRVALTFGCFVVAMVMFRSASVVSGFEMLSRMAVPRPGLAYPAAVAGFLIIAAIMALGHLAANRERFWQRWQAIPTPIRGFGYAGLFIVTLLLTPAVRPSFIYFQF